MDRIPFGIPQLDAIIQGGAPPGSLVLLAGEAGAGAREFLYTSAVINGLGHADSDYFELNYGTIPDTATLPPEIHYLSFTANQPDLEREFKQVINEELVDASIDYINFQDFSRAYFQLSPVPHSWYNADSRRLHDLNNDGDNRDLLESLGDYLDNHAAGNLVLIDSFTDLTAIVGDRMDWSDLALLIKGLRRAAKSWDGLMLLLLDMDSLPATKLGTLMSSADGSFVFEWASGGNELDRTMVVKEFRGVLSEIEEEDIVRFETEIGDGGFDISDIRKIR